MKSNVQPIRRPIMTDPKNPAEPPTNLAEWEKRLAPALRQVELVGEIPISKDELGDISLHFSRQFSRHSEQVVLEAIGRSFPVTFMVFMVSHGIYGYNMGDFWPAYEKALHRSINRTAFGQLFEKLIKRFHKPQFRDLQEKSLRYVSLILAHGGIPVYCLKDFFTNIVLNTASRPQLTALDGEELVEEVLKHSSYTAHTDKPALYFLEYGGRPAANLLDRSRRLLTDWLTSQTIPTAQEAGLPVHLMDYFSEWARENTGLVLDRGPRNRLKRPQLTLDPWGLGVFLFLPAQPISALDQQDLRWMIETGSHHEEIKVRTQRKGEQVETREATIRLRTAPENLFVQFWQGENHYDWKMNGYSPGHLILAFDPVSGQAQNHISAREIWLVYPKEFSVSIQEGFGNLLELLPELPGEWSRFKLECWDLSEAIRLAVKKNEQIYREIYIRSQEKVLQPFFTGGALIPTDQGADPNPCYAGTPPEIHIPLARSEDNVAELSRWWLKILNSGPASPEVNIQVNLAELSAGACTVVQDTAMVRLDHHTLLGRKPTGMYQISLKGPLGRDALLALQILPECHLEGIKDLYIPDPTTNIDKVTFSLQTALLDSVDTLHGDAGICIHTQQSGMHRVEVPPGTSSVGLLIRRETINGQYIRIPIYLRLNHLRWRFVSGDGVIEKWLQKPVTQPVVELLQEESPLLIVDLPGKYAGQISLQLNVLDIQGRVIQQCSPAEKSAKRVNRFWRFDLSRIKHAIEKNDSPIFRIELVGSQNGQEVFCLPVMLLTSEIKVMQLKGEVYSSPTYHHILITWQESKLLHSRGLILWSLFRPWQSPIMVNIPDAVNGEFEFQISRQDHAGGIYRMQMVVVDPWAPAPPPPVPPAASSPGCVELEISAPLEQLKKLDREVLSTGPRAPAWVSHRIELALIRQYLGQTTAAYRDLEGCCRNLLQANSREILTLRAILLDLQRPDLLANLGKQIVSPEIIHRLYADLNAARISIDELSLLISHAPSPKEWPVSACEILVQVEDSQVRGQALAQLAEKNVEIAATWILKLLDASKISAEDAVELLYEEKPKAIEFLKRMTDRPGAGLLLDLLTRFNLYSGLPLVKIGSWVLTNAGWGRIDEILDPRSRVSVDSFLQGEGNFLLSVTLHITESYDLSGEKALINMKTNELTFTRASKIFTCPDCQEFISAKLEIFKNHTIMAHGRATIYPGEKTNVAPLKNIQFNQNPKQHKRND